MAFFPIPPPIFVSILFYFPLLLYAFYVDSPATCVARPTTCVARLATYVARPATKNPKLGKIFLMPGQNLFLTSALRHPAGEHQLTILEIWRCLSVKKFTLTFSIS